jgi:hypothetical protein
VVPVLPGEKNPTALGWTTRSAEPEEFTGGSNCGLMGGPLSNGGREGHGGLIVELDAPEALARADEFLPATGMEGGRPSKPRDRRVYLTPLPPIPKFLTSTAPAAAPAMLRLFGHAGPRTLSFCFPPGPDGKRKEAFRVVATGGQATVAPSRHETGEVRRWGEGGPPDEPAVVDMHDLYTRCCDFAQAIGALPPKSVAPGQVPAGLKASDYVIRQPPPRDLPEVDWADATVQRAVKYLDAVEPAVAGSGGHGQTLWAARVVVRGFGLGPEAGFVLLREKYNPRCQPAWSDLELWHKAEEAAVVPFDKPDGWLLAEGPPAAAEATAAVEGVELPAGWDKAWPAHWLAEPVSAAAAVDLAALWVWKDFLFTGGITLLTALWKSGKTTVLGHLLLALRDGGEFLGRPVRKARVTIVTEESRTVWALRRETLGLSDDVLHLIYPPFRGRPSPAQWLSFLSCVDWQTRRHRPADVVILDTIGKLWSVTNENDAAEVAAALSPVRPLAEGRAVLLTHHPNKSQSGSLTMARGSGELSAFPDVLAEMRYYRSDERDRRREFLVVSRVAETVEFVAEYRGVGCYLVLGDKAEVSRVDLLRDVKALLAQAGVRQPPGWDADAIKAALAERGVKAGLGRLKHTLRDAAGVGSLVCLGKGARGDPWTFWLPKTPRVG